MHPKMIFKPCAKCNGEMKISYFKNNVRCTKCVSCSDSVRTNVLTGEVIGGQRRKMPTCPICGAKGVSHRDLGKKRYMHCKGEVSHDFVVWKETLEIVTNHKPRTKNGEAQPRIRPSRAKHPPRIPKPSKPTNTNASKTKREESVKIFTEMKTCSKCNESKPVIHFRHYKTGLYPQCKHCENLKASQKTAVIDNARLRIEARRDLMVDIDPLFG
jgi:ssDNA-binding Zn-finger/Zn-ribbon topoisomerase 1